MNQGQIQKFSLKTIFWNLTFKLELFTVFVPIPTYVFFIVILGSSGLVKSITAVVLAGIICGTYTVFWGIGIRYIRIKNIFNNIHFLSNNKLNDEEKQSLKLDILNFPFKESRTIVERWLLGGLTGALIYFLISGEVRMSILYTILYGFLFTIPISFVLYGFISENLMRKLLNQKIFHDIHVDEAKVPFLGYFRRISLILVAVTLIPTSIFGLFLYASVNNLFKVNNPGLSIIIVCVQIVLAIGCATYFIGSSIKSGLSEANKVIEELGKGNLSVEMSRISSDEFGKQGQLLKKVIFDLRKMYNEIKDLNQNLEKKVEDRTLELSESLEKISTLKFQQDADYFLTTLLLKPLSYNASKNKNCKIDFITKQYKNFHFKNKLFEIGGDICIVDEICLRKRVYSIFINADAMGKSIQGAGGCLVLGSVFQAILQRTKTNDTISSLYPETWIHSTYIEMHKVFESFDGSMLISAVLGLVDDATGFIYYINLEHPFISIYRDKKASFIENENSLRKIGFMGIEPILEIKTIHLRDGDSLIFGSDGKDDLILEYSELDNKRVINEDESLILKIIEEEDGDITKIKEHIEKNYKLMDDFSILSIQFNSNSDLNLIELEIKKIIKSLKEKIQEGKNQEAIELLENNFYKYLSNVKIANILVDFYIKNKLIDSFKDRAEDLIYICSKDIQTLYKMSKFYKANRFIHEAIEISERIKLREPNNIKNLIHLADMYTYLNLKSKAEPVIKYVLEKEPNHELALRIKNKI